MCSLPLVIYLLFLWAVSVGCSCRLFLWAVFVGDISAVSVGCGWIS